MRVVLPAKEPLTLAGAERNLTKSIDLRGDQQDHDFLHALFSDEGWILHFASSLAPASAILRRAVVEALITEADLPFGTWKDVLSVMDLRASRPMVIVTSLNANDALWAEALSHGAYDVLTKPFNKTELVCVLNSCGTGT